MVRTSIVWKNLSKGSNSETKKGRAILLYAKCSLDLIHIAKKFQDIPYGYLPKRFKIFHMVT